MSVCAGSFKTFQGQLFRGTLSNSFFYRSSFLLSEKHWHWTGITVSAWRKIYSQSYVNTWSCIPLRKILGYWTRVKVSQDARNSTSEFCSFPQYWFSFKFEQVNECNNNKTSEKKNKCKSNNKTSENIYPSTANASII